MKTFAKIAKKVRKFRTNNCLTKTGASVELGIPRRTLGRIEAADQTDYTPTLHTAKKLAAGLGMKVVHTLVKL